MNKLNVKQTNDISTVQLENGKANIIDSEMIDELSKVFKEIESDDSIRAVVLTGKDGFFSAGLDIFQLIAMNKAEINDFFTRFIGLLKQMIQLNKISIASITGHSPAGGCVLALTCDYRIMVKGNYKIGLNEIPVGMMIPKLIWKMMSFAIGKQMAYQMILSGNLLTPEEAQNIGLVHEIIPYKEIDTTTNSKIDSWLSLNNEAWRKSKKLMLEDYYQFSKSNYDDLTEFSSHWWSESFQIQLKAMAEKLKK